MFKKLISNIKWRIEMRKLKKQWLELEKRRQQIRDKSDHNNLISYEK